VSAAADAHFCAARWRFLRAIRGRCGIPADFALLSWFNAAPVRRLLFLIPILAAVAVGGLGAGARAQEPDGPGAEATSESAEPDNKHVQLVRYAVAAHGEIRLPKVGHESLLMGIRGQFRRISEDRAEEDFRAGGAVWDRGGAAYTVRNTGDFPAEFVDVELKDSYANGQLYAPSSERDAVALDAQHFRVILENEHVRLARLLLAPRQGTMDGQFRMRLEIPLQAMRVEISDVDGPTKEIAADAGSATWHESGRIRSIVNLDEQDLDMLILELKHPFCYPALNEGWDFPPGTDPATEHYVRNVREAVGKSWRKHMPREVREGQKGLLTLRFKVQNDGTLLEDDTTVVQEFANEMLLEKSLSALRQAAPFPAFPSSFRKADATFRFIFSYSLPPNSPGCP
jgi:hypothetical protein